MTGAWFDSGPTMADPRCMVGFGGWVVGVRRWLFVASLGIIACGGDASGDASASADESGGADGASENGSSNAEATVSADGGSADGQSEGASADSGELPPGVECDDPQPILQRDSDMPSGFVQCSDGFIHRVEAVTCEAPTPMNTCVPDPTLPAPCETAADCTERPYGACAQQLPSSGMQCACEYGCATDADCGEGEICLCAGLGGGPVCIPASCVTDADCDGMCGLQTDVGFCGDVHNVMACLDETSECRTTCPDAEACDGGVEPASCLVIDSEWVCLPLPCGGCG
jgi:hypothetical protein